MLVEGTDHVHAELVLAAIDLVVEPPSEREVSLVGFVTQFLGLQYIIEDHFVKFVSDLGSIDLGVLDLLLDIFSSSSVTSRTHRFAGCRSGSQAD